MNQEEMEIKQFHCKECGSSLESDRLLCCVVPDCSDLFCKHCFGKAEAYMGKEDHEFYFMCEGNEGTCGDEAIWECQEESIAFCDACFKMEHKGRRKSHSKIDLQRKRLKCEEQDNVNIFDASCFGEMKHEIVLADEERKWMQISADNWNRFKSEARDEYSPVISFIGSTGTGKSFLVGSFVGDDISCPTVAPTNQKGSTSANINLFHAPGYDTDEFSFRRLFLLDCEGDGGTVPEMLRQRWLPLQNKLSKKLNFNMSQNRTHIIREEFPRFAYLTSDVIVFLETVDFTRIQDYLAKFQKFIDATQKGVLSATTPSLLIVQNKVDPMAVNNRLSVEEATEDFFNLAFPFAADADLLGDSDSEEDENVKEMVQEEIIPLEGEIHVMDEAVPILPQQKSKEEKEEKEEGRETEKKEKKKKKSRRRKKKEKDLNMSSSANDIDISLTKNSSKSKDPLKRLKRKKYASSMDNCKDLEKQKLKKNGSQQLVHTEIEKEEIMPLQAGANSVSTISPNNKTRALHVLQGVEKGALTMLQGVEKGATALVPTAIGESLEKVSSNVKGSVGGVAGRVNQMGGRVRNLGNRNGPEVSEKQRLREARRKRNEFLNSFDLIRCVRIPNYRYNVSIEPNLKSFRDEVKKMVNHHAAKRLKNGTNYSESVWLDITKELVTSCTSFSDSQVGIRMAQIIGKVMQPASGEELSASIYNFFNILIGETACTKEKFINTRHQTQRFLTLILANQLRKTGTKIEDKSLLEDKQHPFHQLCLQMFESSEKSIHGLMPCEFRSRKETCTQMNKDHGELHRFASGKKKSGEILFIDPEDATKEIRSSNFINRVYKYLKKFHKQVPQSIICRIRDLSKIDKPEFLKSKAINVAFSQCLLCFSHPHDTLLTCRHSFCKHCVKEAGEVQSDLLCPLCSLPFSVMVDNYKIPGHAGYRILSLDGGGIKGIIELCILKEICSFLPGCLPYQLFDLVVGTSTGAIVGAAIALCKKDIDNALTLYKQFPAKVFKKKMMTNSNLGKMAYLLMGGKHLYRVSVLENILMTLIDMDCDFIETANDCNTPKVAFVSTNYSANPLRPTMFCNYSCNSTTEQYEDVDYVSTCKIHQGVTASAAAPLFFAPYRIDNVFYVDGALSANNPSELAHNESRRLWPKRNLDYMLSLGTGIPPTETISDSVFSWAATLTAKATDPMLVCQREKLKYFRMQEERSLVDRLYFRLNPENVSVDLDSTSAKALEDLVHLTLEYLQEPDMQKEMKVLTNTIIAKAYYIDNDLELSTSGDKIKISFSVRLRIPLETQHKGFLFNHTPKGNFPPVTKTYDEVQESDKSHRISFLVPPTSVHETSIQLVVGPNDTPIHISGSPITITATP